MYGTMYGMEKTTIYLDERQVQALRRRSEETGSSMAELIRTAIDEMEARRAQGARPTFGIFASGSHDTARTAEEVLAAEGFGH